MAIWNPFAEVGDTPWKLTPASWIVAAVDENETDAPLSGYPVIFPGADDALAWLRDAVFSSDVDGHDGEWDAEARNVIDALRLRASAPDVIARALRISESSGTFNVRRSGSVHDYLDRTGTVEHWRAALGDNSVSRRLGVWSMSEASWQRIADAMCGAVAFVDDLETLARYVPDV